MKKDRQCSLVVYKGGKRLAGTAAILHDIKNKGGYDKFLQDFAVRVVSSYIAEIGQSPSIVPNKPSLAVVK